MKLQRLGWLSGGNATCEPPPAHVSRPARLVLLGPPGVGKGTQAQLLCEELRACHLSTGDLFRAAKCDGPTSPAMQQALAAMRRGELVSDKIVIEMVRERANCLRCQGGFLLDGFPRTVRQAEALDTLLTELQVSLHAAICFELPVDEIVARLSGRRTCRACNAVYHIASQPPHRAGQCDRCGEQLMQRDDDQPQAIRVRMQVYEDETQPLLDFYERRGQLLRIAATGSPAEIFARTLHQFERCAYDMAG